jgi:hypothetical protein
VPDGAYLEAAIDPLTLPANLTMQAVFEPKGKEQRFDFAFGEFSTDSMPPAMERACWIPAWRRTPTTWSDRTPWWQWTMTWVCSPDSMSARRAGICAMGMWTLPGMAAVARSLSVRQSMSSTLAGLAAMRSRASRGVTSKPVALTPG